MPSRDDIIELFLADDFEDRLAALGPVEMAATMRRLVEAVAKDPAMFPELPAELVEAIAANVGKLEDNNKACDIAQSKLAAAVAKRDAMYDAILSDPDPTESIH